MRAVETLARFRRDERGAILIFFALALVVILGFAALAFDLGRTASTQTELQSYADNLALAAAGELDGDTNARQRARDAAAQIAADYANNGRFNDLTFLTVDLSDYELTFYASIREDDDDDDEDAEDTPATGDADARYVAARVAPQGVGLTVTRAFDALLPDGETRDDPEVGATAVAVYRQLACATVPMFFCMPESGWRAEDNIGQMIRLRSGGGGGGGFWEPGNFGFLLPPEGFAADGPCAGKSGAQLRRCFFGAENSVNQCFDQIGVDTSTGQQIGVASRALNVRFDEYQGPLSSNDQDYRPAPNVIQGRREEGDHDSHGATMPLPRDACFESDDCDLGRIGDGNIAPDDLYEYLARNHGESDGGYSFTMRDGTAITRRAYDDEAIGGDLDEEGLRLQDQYDDDTLQALSNWLNDLQNRPPRYEIYRSEIDRVEDPTSPFYNPGGDLLNLVTGQGPQGFDEDDFGHKTESGRAMDAPTWSPDPDRRMLVGAGINCNGFTGQTDDLPVEEFVRLFLTERVGASNDPTIYVEVAGSAEKTGAVRDLVELVR